MHVVIFGLKISSSWGNGHATLWRALLKAFARRKHSVTFYERHRSYYASARDNWASPAEVKIHIYESMDDLSAEASKENDGADVGLFSSYCADVPAVAH
jgi:spore maturation protein CgeB